jgi:hypothetical protein
MKSSIHRRAFLSKGAMACAACCLLSGSKLNAITKTLNSDEKLIPGILIIAVIDVRIIVHF